jgi:hypothetical protein
LGTFKGRLAQIIISGIDGPSPYPDQNRLKFKKRKILHTPSVLKSFDLIKNFWSSVPKNLLIPKKSKGNPEQ